MSMRDLIDERNRREKLKNSTYKRIQCSLCHTEELARQKRGRRAKRQQEAAERLRLEEVAKSALELERRREMEQRKLLEQAKMPF